MAIQKKEKVLKSQQNKKNPPRLRQCVNGSACNYPGCVFHHSTASTTAALASATNGIRRRTSEEADTNLSRRALLLGFLDFSSV